MTAPIPSTPGDNLEYLATSESKALFLFRWFVGFGSKGKITEGRARSVSPGVGSTNRCGCANFEVRISNLALFSFLALAGSRSNNDDHRFTILKRGKYTVKATKAVALAIGLSHNEPLKTTTDNHAAEKLGSSPTLKL